MDTRDCTLTPLPRSGRSLDEVAMVAARAFHHDPFFLHLDPEPVRRSRFLALFWRGVVANVDNGAVLTGARHPDGRLLGFSLTVPPGHHPPEVAAQLRQLRAGFRSMILHPPALVTGTRYLVAMEKAHPRIEHWYLELLAVDPAAQRSGLGGRLQAAMLEAADEQGVSCYLETQNPENVPYYERFGYERGADLRPVRRGPPLFTMTRPARG